MKRKTIAIGALAFIFIIFGIAFGAYQYLIGSFVDNLLQTPSSNPGSGQAFWSETNTSFQEVVWQGTGGVELQGELVLPKDESTIQATVIVLHGLGDSRLPWRSRMVSFPDEGIAVFLYDQRGHGLSAGFCTMGCREADDVATALNKLDSLGVKTGMIFLMGHSLGGVTAVRAAAKNTDIAGLILASTYYDIRAMSEYFVGNALGFRPPRFLVEAMLGGLARETGCTIDEFDPSMSVSRLPRIPVFLAHGLDDQAVLPSFGQTLALAIGEGVQTSFIKGADHLNLFDVNDGQLLNKIKKFIHQTVKSGGKIKKHRRGVKVERIELR